MRLMNIGSMFSALRAIILFDRLSRIKPFFETLGPKLISLDLRNVSQNVFYALCDNMGLFRKLESLKMDLTCGVWDWSGGGSSQAGPTENFTFPKVGKRLRNFGAIIGDVAIWKKKPGPLDLVNAKHLEELILYINPWYVSSGHDYRPHNLTTISALLGHISAVSACLNHLQRQTTYL